jgi:hypothetical protein
MTEQMTQLAGNSVAVNASAPLAESTRCKHHTRSGRCTMPASDLTLGLCAQHAPSARKLRAADVSTILTADLDDFRSPAQINEFLARLLRLLAQDRIAPRRAAVMAYITNQLLRTSTAIDRKAAAEAADQESRIIFDFDSAVGTRAAQAAAEEKAARAAQLLLTVPYSGGGWW